MRVFVTGASGFIGSALVPELVHSGHEVVGLARSDASADALVAAGAKPHRGSLDDLDSLRTGAAECDGVVHLAFVHDFARYEAANDTDRGAIEAIGTALAGSDRPLVIASGTALLRAGSVGTERDEADPGSPRSAGAALALGYVEQGVRSVIVRLAPSVHNAERAGFASVLVAIAREKGFSAYVGDGAQRWPAVHVRDAATLFRLGLEQATAGTVLHAVGEEGIAVREVADAIGRRFDLPVRSIEPGDADQHFGWLGQAASSDMPASNALTRELLRWEPTGPGLVDDLEHFTD